MSQQELAIELFCKQLGTFTPSIQGIAEQLITLFRAYNESNRLIGFPDFFKYSIGSLLHRKIRMIFDDSDLDFTSDFKEAFYGDIIKEVQNMLGKESYGYSYPEYCDPIMHLKFGSYDELYGSVDNPIIIEESDNE